MDKLIFYNFEEGIAIVEHEGKYYCPSRFLKMFDKNPVTIYSDSDDKIGVTVRPIQISTEFDIFFVFCQEQDTLIIS